MNFDEIKGAVMNVAGKYPISRVVLFGSRANGTAREDSDFDFIIEFDSPVTLITIAEITELLEDLLHASVDVIHGPVKNSDLLEIDKEIEIYAA
ncbi:MAG: nucleotidyltransferase domain-containing protein [Clostridia bacterium]|nr:nucleotidyltransferase domain-containing protein [Clostridia bacterium]